MNYYRKPFKKLKRRVGATLKNLFTVLTILLFSYVGSMVLFCRCHKLAVKLCGYLRICCQTTNIQTLK